MAIALNPNLPVLTRKKWASLRKYHDKYIANIQDEGKQAVIIYAQNQDDEIGHWDRRIWVTTTYIKENVNWWLDISKLRGTVRIIITLPIRQPSSIRIKKQTRDINDEGGRG